MYIHIVKEGAPGDGRRGACARRRIKRKRGPVERVVGWPGNEKKRKYCIVSSG